MSTKVRELRAERAEILDAAQALLDKAASEKRGLNRQEKRSYDGMVYRAEQLMDEIEDLEGGFGPGKGRELAMRLMGGDRVNRAGVGGEFGQVEQAICNYIRNDDRSGLRDLRLDLSGGEYAFEVRLPREMRAVDSTMNVTTAADGGAAVPTGFSGQIALRRNGIRISTRLGVRPVPGKGTTVNFPFENADPSEFAATSEQDDAYAQTYERDVAPVLGNKAFTLAKKTKKLALTEELLDDEDANLMAAIADTIGRAIGLTHNSMLLTEVAANGTALKTFASASAISADEPDDLVFHSTIGYYLDDGGAIGWVMRPTTLGAIKKLSGNARLYDNQTAAQRMSLLEYPVVYSNAAAAIQASAKSLYFGNFYYVGMREDPALRLIRDPYTTDGVTYLKYSFRACYGVLIAGAVGYGQHPTG